MESTNWQILCSPIKAKEKETQITKIQKKIWVISTDHTEVTGIIREQYDQNFRYARRNTQIQRDKI